MAPVSPAVRKTKATTLPNVLLVDDEPAILELVRDVVGHMPAKVHVAKSIAQARKMMLTQSFDLLLADVHLPDGDGTALVAQLRSSHPNASAIVITGQPSVDGAVSAIRGGASDFLAKPFSSDQLVDRVRKALERQSLLARQEKRLIRLRDAVRKLGQARRMVGKKVDLLCNDLVGAYGELSRQIDIVRTEESFRKQIRPAKDLEQLLCHTMDWLLRTLGYANVALWLAGEDGRFQLGAYMKHTIPGDDALADAMSNALLPGTTRDGFLHINGEQLRGAAADDHYRLFKDQDILSINCSYLGESLAAIIFFRDASNPFAANDEATLKSIAPVLAVTLATVVRDAIPEEDRDEDGDSPFADDENETGKSSRRDDWWKRGESPPF